MLEQSELNSFPMSVKPKNLESHPANCNNSKRHQQIYFIRKR